MKLNCQFPRLIIHPLALERIVRYGNYTIKGRHYEVKKSKKHLYQPYVQEIHPTNNFVCPSDIDNCYIADTASGELYPLYLQVRCGRCENCRQSKVAAFVQRCELETQMYDCKPLFITLTYEERKKPKEGLNVRDVQLFFKRLRVNLARKGYTPRLRYVICGEYGRRTHRPHYHAIVWNLRQTDMVEYRQIRETIESSWSNGWVMSRFVDPSDNKTFYYTAKYLRKDSCIPDGCNKPFICSSNRGGGIGSAYLYGQVGHFLRFLDTSPKYVNKFNGQVKDLQVCAYVLDKILPSFSKSVPSVIKNHLRRMNLCYATMQLNNDPNIHLFSQSYERFNDFFGQYVYCPQITPQEVEMFGQVLRVTPQKCVRDLLESEKILDKWHDKGREYFERALKLNDRRAYYLQKFFETHDEIDDDIVIARCYNFRKSSALAQQREIL